MLEGRMPNLRHALKQLSSQMRKLRTKDGQMIDVTYHGSLGHLSETVHCINKHGHANVLIMNADSPAKAENIFDRIGGEIEFAETSILAFTKAKVFNQPRLQNLVQSMLRTTRFGMVVEDEPEKITLSRLEATLKEWIPVWSREWSREDHEHSPYLAIRQRLSDSVTGRLDGGKIGKLFGLSTAEMGTICGVSKQSIHANPTSKGIQEKLEPLVKAARGVLWCGGDEAKFKTWLNQPNPDFPEYEGRQLSPLDLIRMGHAQVIADKVQNLLTGHPS